MGDPAEVAVEGAGDAQFGRAEMFAEVKRNLIKVVKEDVRQEAFGFSEIPHKQPVRQYLKEVRELVTKCSQMEGSTKLASIETAVSAALDILGVALREGESLAGEIRAIRAKRATFSAEAAKEHASREAEREIESLRRQLKREEAKAVDATEKHATCAADLEASGETVRSLTTKLADIKQRARSRLERAEEELGAAESRHSRELEKLRRKMRQEKQEELTKALDKMRVDVKREVDADRSRSSQSADAFWKTRFETLEKEHRAEVARSSQLQADLAAARQQAAVMKAREKAARDKLDALTADAGRAATEAAVSAAKSKADMQELANELRDTEKKLAKEKKKTQKAKTELSRANDKLSTAEEDATRTAQKEKRRLEAKVDEASEQVGELEGKVARLEAKVAKTATEAAAEKELHKKSKAKFTKSFGEAKATQESLRAQISELTSAKAKAGTTKESLTADIVMLKGTIKELKAKLMLSEEAVAAADSELQGERTKAAAVRSELSELQFTQLQQEATGGRKLYDAQRKLKALEGEVQSLKKNAREQHEGAALLAEVLERPPLSEDGVKDGDDAPPQLPPDAAAVDDHSDTNNSPVCEAPSLDDNSGGYYELEEAPREAKAVDDEVDEDEGDKPQLPPAEGAASAAEDKPAPPPLDDLFDSDSEAEPIVSKPTAPPLNVTDDFDDDGKPQPPMDGLFDDDDDDEEDNIFKPAPPADDGLFTEEDSEDDLFKPGPPPMNIADDDVVVVDDKPAPPLLGASDDSATGADAAPSPGGRPTGRSALPISLGPSDGTLKGDLTDLLAVLDEADGMIEDDLAEIDADVNELEELLDTNIAKIDGILGGEGAAAHGGGASASKSHTKPAVKSAAVGLKARKKPPLPNSPKPVLKSAQLKMKAKPKPASSAKPTPKKKPQVTSSLFDDDFSD